MPTTKQVNILFLISLLLNLSLGSILQKISLTFGGIFTQIFCILIPVLLFSKRLQLDIKQTFCLNNINWRIIILCVLIGCSSWSVGIPLAIAEERLFGVPPLLYLLKKEITQIPFFLFLPTFTILPGICEEFFFRGLIQTTYYSKGYKKAIIYSSLLFALGHFSPWRFLTIVYGGLILGYIFYLTNSLYSSIIIHIINNGVASIAAYIYVRQGSEAMDFIPSVHLPIILTGAFILIVSLFLISRLSKPERKTIVPVIQRKRLIEQEWFFVFIIVISLFVMGSLSLIGQRYKLVHLKHTQAIIGLSNKNRHYAIVDTALDSIDAIKKYDLIFMRVNSHNRERKIIRTVIGIEGEIVEIRKGMVYINRIPLSIRYSIDENNNYGPIEIPKGHIFVLAEGSGIVFDSRYFGCVSKDDILGKIKRTF